MGRGGARPYRRGRRSRGSREFHRSDRTLRRPCGPARLPCHRRGRWTRMVGSPHPGQETLTGITMPGYILGRTSSARRDFGFTASGFAERARPEHSELITYAGDGHLITFAPTGTGKTSGPVICNALKHPGQLIVLDMKGEVYAATANARRAMGQEVCVLDLRDDGVPGSLNPLDLAVSCGTDIAAV